MTTTWRQLAIEAEDQLAQISETPAVDAKRIVERASGNEGAEYILGLDEAVTERGMFFFDQMLARRLTGEPLQYVLGRWGFRRLDLLVDKRVLIPRPETELVTEYAIKEIERLQTATDRVQVVDLGTGSGAIGLSIAFECERVDVVLTDYSADALAVARANLAGIGRAATKVRVYEGSWFDALPSEQKGTFGVIVSNPPYVATTDRLDESVVRWEPHAALFAGDDGLDDLRILFSQSPDWLCANGALVVEIGESQVDAVRALASEHGFTEIFSYVDLSQRPRVIVARR
ncbi:MAG: peptide chain release factor N(5)-glutamine methyltransferase [Actinomycetota bacterium]|jgi:release factor glutamine methyltransferase